jgi:hypothetical protein
MVSTTGNVPTPVRIFVSTPISGIVGVLGILGCGGVGIVPVLSNPPFQKKSATDIPVSTEDVFGVSTTGTTVSTCGVSTTTGSGVTSTTSSGITSTTGAGVSCAVCIS